MLAGKSKEIFKNPVISETEYVCKVMGFIQEM